MVSRAHKRLVKAIGETDYYYVLYNDEIAGTDGRIYGKICGDIVQFYNQTGDCPIVPIEDIIAVGHDDEDDYYDTAGAVHNDGAPFVVIRRLGKRSVLDRLSHRVVIDLQMTFNGRMPVSQDWRPETV